MGPFKIIKSDHCTVISELHKKNQTQNRQELMPIIQKIQAGICKEGDTALERYTRQLDKIQCDTFELWVSAKEIKDAYKQVSKPFVEATMTAIKNLAWYHKKQVPKSWYTRKKDGVSMGMKYTPIDRVGLYVPGGRAPYFSSVLMNAVPAKVAGVTDIIISTPPKSDGAIHPAILVAADLCGVSQILKAGGAQAVFAMAYGTKSVKKVDKIVGPGNIYVTLAKQLVFGEVAIDKPAGPSEALIYVNQTNYAASAAAELLSQLEHDPDASAVGISEDETVLKAVITELKKQITLCQRQTVVEKSINNLVLMLAKDQKEAIALINEVASEHTVLLTDTYEKLALQINNAGALFLGPYTPVALGDYYAGTNHVLPTAGAARFASPLSVLDFVKFSSLLCYPKAKLKKAYPDLKTMCETEGFDAHLKSIEIRLNS